MNGIILTVLIIFVNLSLEHPQFVTRPDWCEPEEPPPPDTRRISLRKCDEYKKLVAKDYFISGGIARCSSKKIVEYKCNSFTGLILGGEKAKPGEFPHMAAIGWKDSSGNIEFKCGGSLISERFVITVAHCVKTYSGLPTVVRLGDQNLANNNDGAEPKEYKIAETIVPPQYDPYTKKHDIALLKLEKDVTFTNFTRPACLASLEFSKTVVATGWGKTDTFSETSDELMKVVLNTVDSKTCYEMIGDELNADEIYHTQICAGGVRNKDTCQGDSGGPIQVAHSDAPCVYNIVGLTSYGLPVCGSRAPSIYTRISPYLSYIERKVWPNNL